MAESSVAYDIPAARAEDRPTARHSALVRVTHWITSVAVLALLLTGIEIVISHPRFYWGEVGNVNTPFLFRLPIPASRRTVDTGYGYVMPDQNGWSRSLHFEAAWILVSTGLLYLAYGFLGGHFRRNLLPSPGDRSAKRLVATMARHLRLGRPKEEDAWSYNPLQRLTYSIVIFLIFPLMIWTGLAMSPAIEGALPIAVILLGGRQTARTLHFFLTILLVMFVLVHVLMVVLSGFRERVGAMITGRVKQAVERS